MKRQVFPNVRLYRDNDVEVIDRLMDTGEKGLKMLKNLDRDKAHFSAHKQTWASIYFDSENSTFLYFMAAPSSYEEKNESILMLFESTRLIDLFGYFVNCKLHSKTQRNRDDFNQIIHHIKRAVKRWQDEKQPFLENQPIEFV